MRFTICLGSAVIALLCTSGAALAQKSGGVLRVYHRENPPSASILEEATASTTIPFMPVFNNLVMYDQQVPQNSAETIVPDLAKSWAWNAEGTELTFQLHDGVKWHDGKPFSARDVVCTFDLLLDKAPQRLRRNPRSASAQRDVRVLRGRLSTNPPSSAACVVCVALNESRPLALPSGRSTRKRRALASCGVFMNAASTTIARAHGSTRER